MKLEFGGDGTFTKVTTGADALPVLPQSNSGVDIGDVTVNNGVGASAVPIQDGGNTITVDGTVAVTHAALTELGSAIDTEVQVDVVAALPAGTNTIGNVVPVPATSGGLTIFRSLDLDESEEEVKATAGQLYGVWITNTATTTRWIKFYNLTAANTSVGSSTPLITVGIPGNTSDDIAAMFSGAQGIAFDTAITVAATTGVADADTGAPGANDVIINVFYK